MAADPDYLVVGRSRPWGLYDAILATTAFRQLHAVGRYVIYERIR